MGKDFAFDLLKTKPLKIRNIYGQQLKLMANWLKTYLV